ncbi:MAG TPA: hypothetical protein VFB08_06865 [Burkholderiales bacterium]|nr:hypothetical protein [Burkholderiales bacterium]
MRRRALYVLVFAAPALLASLAVAAIVLVFAVAIFWLFIFGDNTWPDYAGVLLGVLSAGAGLAVFGALLYHAYAAGERQEARPALDRRHLAGALAATLVLLALPALYAWHISRPGGPEQACADFCRARGFNASGLPARGSGDETCTCYDVQGKAAASVSPGGPRKR